MRAKPSWIRNVHPWGLTVLCCLAIAADAWEILAPDRWKIGLRDQIPSITLALFCVYVLVYLHGSKIHRDRLWELGIANIYRGRYDEGQMRSYERLMREAKHELLIVGITLKQLSAEQYGYLVDRAAADCTVDLLMLSPTLNANTNPILDPVAHAMGLDLRQAFADSITRIRSLAREISRTSGKLRVRFYVTAPTLSLTAKDAGTRHGEMHVEIVPHQVHKEPFRPILHLTKNGTEQIFSDIYERYRELFDQSKAYISVNAPHRGMKVDSGVDIEISRSLGIAAIHNHAAGAPPAEATAASSGGAGSDGLT